MKVMIYSIVNWHMSSWKTIYHCWTNPISVQFYWRL